MKKEHSGHKKEHVLVVGKSLSYVNYGTEAVCLGERERVWCEDEVRDMIMQPYKPCRVFVFIIRVLENNGEVLIRTVTGPDFCFKKIDQAEIERKDWRRHFFENEIGNVEHFQ